MERAGRAKTKPLWLRREVARLLVVALLAEIGFAVLNISTMPVYLREDRGFGEGVIALVVTTFLLSEALFKGTMGHLADRHGRRRLMVLGTGLTALTPLLTMLVPLHWGYGETIALMALRAVDGVGVVVAPATAVVVQVRAPVSLGQRHVGLDDAVAVQGVAGFAVGRQGGAGRLGGVVRGLRRELRRGGVRRRGVGRVVVGQLQQRVVGQHLLDFLRQLQRGQLQQADGLLQLGGERQMLGDPQRQTLLHRPRSRLRAPAAYMRKCSPR